MKLHALVFATALFALPAAAVLAQAQPYQAVETPKTWKVDIGGGVVRGFSATGNTSDEFSVTAWGSASYRDVIYANGLDGLGWNAIKRDDFRAGVQLRPRFAAGEIEGSSLDRPDLGADATIYAYKRLPGNVVVGGRVQHDVTGDDAGVEVMASVGHQRVTPVGLLNASVYVRGGNSKLADAYYGVSTAEAAANGISAYSPGGGLQGAGASLVLLVPVGDKWGAGALLNYERRLGDVADSPLSQSDDAVRTGVFIARRFGG